MVFENNPYLYNKALITCSFQSFNIRPHPAITVRDEVPSAPNGILAEKKRKERRREKRKEKKPAPAMCYPVEGAANSHIHSSALA